MNTKEGERKGRTYIRMRELGPVIWLSVNLVIKSPDPKEHGGGLVLRWEKLPFLSCKDFKLNKE